MIKDKVLELAAKQRLLSDKLRNYSLELKKLEDHNKLEEEDLNKARELENLIEKIESLEIRLLINDKSNKKAVEDLKKTIIDSKACLNDINHEDIKSLVNDSNQLFLDTSKLVEDIASLI
jgi:hypothetical protein